MQWAIQIDSDDLIPESEIGFQEWRSLVPAGDIGKQLDRSSSGFERFGGARDLGVVADVHLITKGFPRSFSACADCLRGAIFVNVENAHHAAFLDQPDRGGAPDPARAAGEYDAFPIQTAHSIGPRSACVQSRSRAASWSRGR